DALYVPTVGQHEFAMLAKQARRVVTGLPGGDVVGGAGDAEHLRLDGLEVDRGAADLQRAGGAQRVAAEQLDQVVVQGRRQAGGVVVPVEDVELRRQVAEQVVVHPVVRSEEHT